MTRHLKIHMKTITRTALITLLALLFSALVPLAPALAATGGGRRTFTRIVPALSRTSFSMADDIGAADASIKVESDVPVIPERAMYTPARREGHDSIGTTTPSRECFLAEGTTAWGFTTYLLVQNPNAAPASVTLTYMTADGPRRQVPFSMPANARKTVRVNDVLAPSDFSTLVDSDVPVIAERAMYWDDGTGKACHDSIGVSAPHDSFFLPGGVVDREGAVESWTLVQNPGGSPVRVKVSYLLETGKGCRSFEATMPAGSRRTFEMADILGDGRAAVEVDSLTSGGGIVSEMATYSNGRGAGTDTIRGYLDR